MALVNFKKKIAVTYSFGAEKKGKFDIGFALTS